MRNLVGYLVVILFLLLAIRHVNKYGKKEHFGTDNKPFEPENTLLNRNPWDDIDYVVPVFRTPA
jgi:hypothetical protein